MLVHDGMEKKLGECEGANVGSMEGEYYGGNEKMKIAWGEGKK